jgi:hypothetical protein
MIGESLQFLRVRLMKLLKTNIELKKIIKVVL